MLCIRDMFLFKTEQFDAVFIEKLGYFICNRSVVLYDSEMLRLLVRLVDIPAIGNEECCSICNERAPCSAGKIGDVSSLERICDKDSVHFILLKQVSQLVQFTQPIIHLAT